MKIKQLSVLLLALALLVLAVTPALAKGPKGPPAFGMLFYNDHVVRTVVPPAAAPQEGRDDLYVFPDGAAPDQLPVIAVAPGDTDYHGGQWAVHTVTWNVEPYLLTSAQDVLDAETAGDVTITRVPEADFKCPVQP